MVYKGNETQNYDPKFFLHHLRYFPGQVVLADPTVLAVALIVQGCICLSACLFVVRLSVTHVLWLNFLENCI